LSKDRTLVFSTHDLSNAYKLADRIITLQSGKVSPWTPENVFRLTASRTDDGYELLTEAGLSVYYPGDLEDGKEYIVSVNTNEVLASMQPIETSARNSYNGVIQKIEKSGTRTVLVTVNCGSGFQLRVTLTDRAMKELGLGVGDELWVHFKSTAVHVHQ
jgi:molybdopterin-binding protein